MSIHTQEPLDDFDIALLAQLRAEVGKAPARKVKRGVVSLAGVAAAATAAIVGVTAFGSSTPAFAAYAIDRGTNGDITIVIHQLSDAAGLQKELASYGIKAQVNYQPTPQQRVHRDVVGDLDQFAKAHGTDGKSTVTMESGQSSLREAPNRSADLNAMAGRCGDPNHPALTAKLGSNDYVITIPKASPLYRADSELSIMTTGDLSQTLAGLSVDYTVDGQHCAMGTMSVGVPAAPVQH